MAGAKDEAKAGDANDIKSKMVVMSNIVHALLVERGEVSADTRPRMLEDLDEEMFVDSKEVVGELKQLIKLICRSVTPNVSRAVAQEAVARFQDEPARTQHASIPEQSNADLEQLLAAFTLLESSWHVHGSVHRDSAELRQWEESSARTNGGGDVQEGQREHEGEGLVRVHARQKVEWVPSVDEKTRRLVVCSPPNREAIYEYAQQNWDSVGDEWLQLFTSREADKKVVSALEAASERDAKLEQKTAHRATSDAKQGPTKPQVVILAVDEARMLLSLQHMKVDYCRLLRRALVMANKTIDRDGGILAVLVDTSSKVCETMTITTAKPDSSSRNYQSNPVTVLPTLVLSHTVDSYWRHQLKEEDIDVGEDEDIPIRAYQSIVMEKDEAKVWRALVGMGRPLWANTFLSASGELDGVAGSTENPQQAVDTVLSLAAQKLMREMDPGMSTCYTKDRMFGVASLLCRLGLRAHSTSSFASQAVADFMATLTYINYKHDGVLSSYESEPALAFGATRMWYSRANSLSDFILPQFKKMVLNETLRADCNGEVVARIVLLLVMDAAVVMESEVASGVGKRYGNFLFKGQFVGVLSFLKLLVGATPRVMLKKASEAPREDAQAFAEWQSKWESWKMGLCQFVQLDMEPTEDTLWFLLGRRAAGVLPRNDRGVDLIIPIFADSTATRVSMILVTVSDLEEDENVVLETKMMSPKRAFSRGNALREKSIADMIRVLFSLREPRDTSLPSRFVVADADTHEDEDEWPRVQTREDHHDDTQLGARLSKKQKSIGNPTASTTRESVKQHEKAAIPSERTRAESGSEEKTLFTYCIRSLEGWEPAIERSTHLPLSKALAERLVDLAKVLWNPEDYIRDDLEACDQDKDCAEELAMVAPTEKLIAAARRTRISTPGLVAKKTHPPIGSKRMQEEAGIV